MPHTLTASSWSRRIVLSALVVLLGTSCARDQAAPPPGRIDLAGAGATFPYPLYRAWFSEYGARSDVHINYFSVGSAEGLRLFSRGDVDFGAVDSKGIPIAADPAGPCSRVAVPMVEGPIAIAYNLPSLSGRVLVLDAAALAGIYAGTVTMWTDKAITALNPSARLPALPITVVRRAVGSGTAVAFREYLSRSSGRPDSASAPSGSRGLAAEGNEGVASEVKVTVGAVGFMELAYATQNRLSVAALIGGDGRVEQAGTASPTYPITTRTWLVFDPTRLTPARRTALIGFARWALREGAGAAAALEYRALSADTIAHYDSLLAAADQPVCPSK